MDKHKQNPGSSTPANPAVQQRKNSNPNDNPVSSKRNSSAGQNRALSSTDPANMIRYHQGQNVNPRDHQEFQHKKNLKKSVDSNDSNGKTRNPSNSANAKSPPPPHENQNQHKPFSVNNQPPAPHNSPMNVAPENFKSNLTNPNHNGQGRSPRQSIVKPNQNQQQKLNQLRHLTALDQLQQQTKKSSSEKAPRNGQNKNVNNRNESGSSNPSNPQNHKQQNSKAIEKTNQAQGRKLSPQNHQNQNQPQVHTYGVNTTNKKSQLSSDNDLVNETTTHTKAESEGKSTTVPPKGKDKPKIPFSKGKSSKLSLYSSLKTIRGMKKGKSVRQLRELHKSIRRASDLHFLYHSTSSNTDIVNYDKVNFTQSEPATSTGGRDQQTIETDSETKFPITVKSDIFEQMEENSERYRRRSTNVFERGYQPYGNIKHHKQGHNRRLRRVKTMLKVLTSPHSSTRQVMDKEIDQVSTQFDQPSSEALDKGKVLSILKPPISYSEEQKNKRCPRLCNFAPCLFVRELKLFCQEYPNFYRLTPDYPSICPRCQKGQFKPDWTPLSIFCCLCVPILGIPCCFAFREYICDHCEEIWEYNDPREEIDDL